MLYRRRWIFRISLCLLLAVVTTVAVAWTFAVVRRPIVYNQTRVPTMGVFHALESNTYWDIALLAETGTAHLRVYAMRSTPSSGWNRTLGEDDVPRWSILRTGGADRASLPTLPTTTEMARGWPFYSLKNRVEEDTALSKREVYSAVRVEIGNVPECALLRRPESFLPLRPIFPGFIIDTVFYAAIWFALFFAPGGFKRWRLWNRKRRGLCPKCAHNLRGNPEGVTGCAECGWGREAFTAESPPEGARSEDSSSVEEQQA